jgi:single-strand DNA-binding protein
MLNRAQLIGHLGQDPEIRHTQAGAMIASFSVATSERWTDKRSGERKERTEWHRVVIFNETLGQVAQKYLRKGSRVFLEGQIATRKWTDKSNIERYTTEIVVAQFGGKLVLLDRAEGERAVESTAGDNLDDDIPF